MRNFVYDSNAYSDEFINKVICAIGGALKLDGHVEDFRQIILDGIYTPYLVSSFGRIISVNYRGVPNNPRVMKQKTSKGLYKEIMICINMVRKTYLVHRLVALMFIPNPENKPEVNHMDGIKSHNFVWNLEWNTDKENDTHARLHGLKRPRYGEEIGNNIYKEEDIRKVCELFVENKYSIKEISEMTGVSPSTVRNIRKGRDWRCVSKDYDFSDYDGRPMNERLMYINMVHLACSMLESNEYKLQEISDVTGLSLGSLNGILNRGFWSFISSQYNIENYKSRSRNHKKEK